MPPKAAGKAAAKPAHAGQEADPYRYWSDFFATTKFKTPAEADNFLFFTVDEMKKAKRFDYAEAALKAFLASEQHGKDAQPWMYEWLAQCVKARKGPEAEMKQAFSFAAYLAKKTKNPNDLVRVADMLVNNNFYGPVGDPGYQTNIGELVDLATEKVPVNVYPMMMSIKLAAHDKDPKRMADAADRVFSLGWPDIDDKVRKDTKEDVKALADALKVDGRADEAEALMARLAESEARDIYIRLTWKGKADIDMRVAEPHGATAKYENRRTVFGGALIKNGYGNHPEEVYVCPRAFDGDYAITVEKIVDWDEDKPVLEANLEVILHEGTAQESREVHKIDLKKPVPIIVKLAKGTGRRKTVLPMLVPVERVIAVPRPKEPARAKAKPANPLAPQGVPFR